jgi:hypothetical protein
MYNASRPRLRGVLRHDGMAWYVCGHDHPDPDAARVCSRNALQAIRKLDPDDLGLSTTAELPEGWHVYHKTYDGEL